MSSSSASSTRLVPGGPNADGAAVNVLENPGGDQWGLNLVTNEQAQS